MKTSYLICMVLTVLLAVVGCNDATAPSEENSTLNQTTSLYRDAGRPLTATLTGAAEVPGPGDPDGSGTALIRLNHGRGEVYFELEVADIVPAFAAHIHIAPAGVAGPVVVPLAPPSSGSSSGTVTGVSRDLIKDMMLNPENYYVNVHNPEFPPGAVRGQLSK